MHWTIQPLLGGEFGMVRDDIKFLGGDPNIQSMVPSLLFFLRDEQGRQIIIDTGFDLQVAESLGLTARQEASVERLFHGAGLKPERVSALLLTHIHWDHAGNCELFPNAQIYCQSSDWKAVFSVDSEHPEGLKNVLKRVEDRVMLQDGTGNILPGIQAIWFGGHTPGSQAFLVDTVEGSVLVCGDDIMTFRNVKDQIPVGLSYDLAGCRRALQYVESEKPDYLLPSHDYRSLEYWTMKESCKRVPNYAVV